MNDLVEGAEQRSDDDLFFGAVVASAYDDAYPALSARPN
jgi:hypothetical protein